MQEGGTFNYETQQLVDRLPHIKRRKSIRRNRLCSAGVGEILVKLLQIIFERKLYGDAIIGDFWNFVEGTCHGAITLLVADDRGTTMLPVDYREERGCTKNNEPLSYSTERITDLK